MRHIAQDGIDLIKRFESFSSTVYICPAGYPTISYGHLARTGETFVEITETEAKNHQTIFSSFRMTSLKSRCGFLAVSKGRSS